MSNSNICLSNGAYDAGVCPTYPMGSIYHSAIQPPWPFKVPKAAHSRRCQRMVREILGTNNG